MFIAAVLRLGLGASLFLLLSSGRAGAQAGASDVTLPPAAAPAAAAEALPSDGTTAEPDVARPVDPPAARPPAINRVNDHLPSWLRVRGEFRERLEGFSGGGFDAAREDLYWLSRLRLDATLTPSDRVRFHVQAQDARVAKKTVGPTGSPFRAPVDLRMAYADIGSPARPVRARVGRQELVYGEQRLVGHVSWVNAARTFDGARVTFRTRLFEVDVFAASVVRILEDEFDRSGNGNRFVGTYMKTGALLPKGTVEPYLFWRRDVHVPTETASRGDLGQATLGVRLAGPMPGRFDYDVEMALQRGSLGSDDVRAWAGHWRLRRVLDLGGAPRVTGEYNYASGDEDPTDGVRGTFDQLYPTAHDKYGLADQIGWRNIHHLRAGLELTPVRTLSVTTNYHSWWLAERRDGIYTAGSAPLARIATGAASRHVGQELDIQVGRPLTPQLQLLAGYAHIFTGRFLKDATPGASYSHPFVMLTYVFLAQK